MAFTAWFTWNAYRDRGTSAAGKQARREAIIEAWIGIVIGFFLNWCVNWVLLPLVGAKFTGVQNWWLGWCYTAISLLRGYGIRRFAQQYIHRLAGLLARVFP